MVFFYPVYPLNNFHQANCNKYCLLYKNFAAHFRANKYSRFNEMKLIYA